MKDLIEAIIGLILLAAFLALGAAASIYQYNTMTPPTDDPDIVAAAATLTANPVIGEPEMLVGYLSGCSKGDAVKYPVYNAKYYQVGKVCYGYYGKGATPRFGGN